MLKKVQKLSMRACPRILGFAGLLALRDLEIGGNQNFSIRSGWETFFQLTTFSSDQDFDSFRSLSSTLPLEIEQATCTALAAKEFQCSGKNILRNILKLSLSELHSTSTLVLGFSA